MQRTVLADHVHVLPQRVGGAAIPVRAALLLRRDDLDELAELAAQVAPAALDVLDQRMRLVLRQHRDLADARVDAVREHEIDDAELAAKGRRGLAAVLGQVLQALAAAAGHDHRQGAPGQAAQVSARRNGLWVCGHPRGRPFLVNRMALRDVTGRELRRTPRQLRCRPPTMPSCEHLIYLLLLT